MSRVRHLETAAPIRRMPLAVAAVAAALAGCAVPLAPQPAPQPSIAARFPGIDTERTPAAGPSADALDWRAFFTDARLRRLIELALAHNRDLRIAVLNIEAAQAQLTVREADRWPTVSAGIAASRSPTGRGTMNTLVSSGVQVTAYEADLFGRVRAAGDAAAAQLQASLEARKAAQISLIGAVAQAYLALAADDAAVEVNQAAVRTREDSLNLVRLRVDNGAGSMADLQQAQSLLESARVGLAQARRQQAGDRHALTLLIGIEPPADLPPGLPLAEASGLPALPVGLPSEVLVRRPDIRQAEQQLVAADANIAAARAAFFPKITLTGSLGSASTELSGLFKAGTWAWTFAPQVLMPLFDAGRNAANLKQAEVSRAIAVAQYEKAVQAAFREVADALVGSRTITEQWQAQQALVSAEQARTDLAELRYRHGVASHLERLDAQRSLLAAQLALVQLQAARAQNLATLYRVLGGGWTGDTGMR